MRLKNENGITLVELLVVIALLSFISLAAATFIYDLQKTFKRTELTQAVELDNLEIASLLVNRAACRNTFQPVGPLNVASAIPFTQILDGTPPTGIVRFTLNQTFPLAPAPPPIQYTLTSIVITNYVPPAVVPGSGARFDVLLVYTFENQTVQPNMTTKRLSFVADVDATHRVTSCSWDRSTEYDDLYINVSGPPETKNGNLTIQGILAVQLNGAAGGFITTEEYYQVSDRRFKKDIKAITHALDKIQQLQGVEFNWKRTGQKDWGLIAQDVEKIAPFLVRTDPKTKYKSVNYNSVIPLTIEALKELESDNHVLENELKDLSEQNQILIQHLCKEKADYQFCTNGRN